LGEHVPVGDLLADGLIRNAKPLVGKGYGKSLRIG
jgi:hypothetical protein